MIVTTGTTQDALTHHGVWRAGTAALGGEASVFMMSKLGEVAWDRSFHQGDGRSAVWMDKQNT